MKGGKICTLGYIVPIHYEPLSADDENTSAESITSNFSTTASEAKVKMLPAMQKNSKIFFLGDYAPVRKFIQQDA